MRLAGLLATLTVALLSLTGLGQWKPQNSGTTAQLRGVSAVNASIAWASGSNGTYLRTTDGGATWNTGAVPGASALDFRDVEGIDARTAFLMATAGKIFKTTDSGNHWTLQYENTSAGIFLDALAFWDPQHGIALGDPINGSFLLIITADGGATWNQVPAAGIPPAIEGEAAFAASGTCINVSGRDHVWFATGGRAARVFRSSDRGRTWKVSSTPIVSGQDSTGIFSIAFTDSKNGLIVGGDYKKPDAANANAARTTDGGVTWKLIEQARPNGFRSAVAYVGSGSSRGSVDVISVGQGGADLSTDGGLSWKSFGSVGFHGLSFATPGRRAWAVGADGRVAAFDAVEGPGTRRP